MKRGRTIVRQPSGTASQRIVPPVMSSTRVGDRYTSFGVEHVITAIDAHTVTVERVDGERIPFYGDSREYPASLFLTR